MARPSQSRRLTALNAPHHLPNACATVLFLIGILEHGVKSRPGTAIGIAAFRFWPRLRR
jgi:hypothetical protein